jgi:hypothetical protein
MHQYYFKVYALNTMVDLEPKQATTHRIAGLTPVRPAIEVLRVAEDLFLLEEMLAYGLRGRCIRRFLPWVSPLLSSQVEAKLQASLPLASSRFRLLVFCV